MKKQLNVFISQPMAGLTDAEIRDTRQKAIEKIFDLFKGTAEVFIIDSYFPDIVAPEGVISPIWYLGKDFDKLSRADILYCVTGWEKARGCRVEEFVAKMYGIEIIYEENKNK